jgi:Family of unknown function (DUF6433)
MGTQIGVAEFLEKVSKLKKKEDKVAALKFNNSYVLRTILQGAFDPRVKWLLPEGSPPFKKQDIVDQEHILIKEARKLAYFVEGAYPNLKQMKRETMFIEFLEALAPADAELVLSIKEKKLPYKGITVDMVREAFPGLLPDEQK